MSSYIYTFVRTDISPEQRIVQIGHACYEAGKRFKDNVGISSLVLLSAANEEELLDISYKLGFRGIDHYVFNEPDFGMGHSALCTAPIIDQRERNFFKRWKLHTHTD